MDLREGRIEYLDDFRALAILFVIGTHALSYVYLSPHVRGLLAFIVHTIAVPTFLLVDGILFVRKKEQVPAFDYPNYVLNSAHRLLVPWVVFTIMYAVLRIGVEVAGFVPERLLYGRSFEDFAFSIYISSIAPHMYFLLVLFFIRALAFITRRLCSIPSFMVLLIWLAYTTMFHVIDLKPFFFPGADPILLTLWGVQFYLLGITLGRYDHVLERSSLVIGLLGFTILIYLKLILPSMIVVAQYVYLIASYCLFLATAKDRSRLFGIGRYTMGVYLLHTPLILKVAAVGLSTILPNNTLGFYLILTCTGLLASIAITRFLVKLPFGRWVLGSTQAAPLPSILSNRTVPSV
jgi:hypothetical protein